MTGLKSVGRRERVRLKASSCSLVSVEGELGAEPIPEVRCWWKERREGEEWEMKEGREWR